MAGTDALTAPQIAFRDAHDPRTLPDLLEAQWIAREFAAVEGALSPHEAAVLDAVEHGRPDGMPRSRYLAGLASLRRKFADCTLDASQARARAGTVADLERRAAEAAWMESRNAAKAVIEGGGSDADAQAASGLDADAVRRVRQEWDRRRLQVIGTMPCPAGLSPRAALVYEVVARRRHPVREMFGWPQGVFRSAVEELLSRQS